MRRLLLAAVPLVLVLSACGSSSSLSHAQYVERANAICAKQNAAGKALANPTTPKELSAVLGKALGLANTEIAGLDALHAPAADRTLAARHVGLLEQEVVGVKQLRKAIAAGDDKGMTSLIRKTTATDRQAKAAAAKLGLTACAK